MQSPGSSTHGLNPSVPQTLNRMQQKLSGCHLLPFCTHPLHFGKVLGWILMICLPDTFPFCQRATGVGGFSSSLVPLPMLLAAPGGEEYIANLAPGGFLAGLKFQAISASVVTTMIFTFNISSYFKTPSVTSSEFLHLLPRHLHSFPVVFSHFICPQSHCW